MSSLTHFPRSLIGKINLKQTNGVPYFQIVITSCFSADFANNSWFLWDFVEVNSIYFSARTKFSTTLRLLTTSSNDKNVKTIQSILHSSTFRFNNLFRADTIKLCIPSCWICSSPIPFLKWKNFSCLKHMSCVLCVVQQSPSFLKFLF